MVSHCDAVQGVSMCRSSRGTGKGVWLLGMIGCGCMNDPCVALMFSAVRESQAPLVSDICLDSRFLRREMICVGGFCCKHRLACGFLFQHQCIEPGTVLCNNLMQPKSLAGSSTCCPPAVSNIETESPEY